MVGFSELRKRKPNGVRKDDHGVSVGDVEGVCATELTGHGALSDFVMLLNLDLNTKEKVEEVKLWGVFRCGARRWENSLPS